MKQQIRTPFFEIGVKNYIYGDDVLALAKAADAAALRYDIDVLFIAPYVDIRRIAENCENLIVFAPYMDTLRPGRGIADVLPEAISAAGCLLYTSSHTFSGTPLVISVSINPGHIAFAVMPFLASSFAAVLVSPTTPAFAAA